MGEVCWRDGAEFPDGEFIRIDGVLVHVEPADDDPRVGRAGHSTRGDRYVLTVIWDEDALAWIGTGTRLANQPVAGVELETLPDWGAP